MRGDVLLLQLRSVVRFARKKQFVKEIHDFAKANEIKDIVLLASLPYSLKQDLEITSTYLFNLSSDKKMYTTGRKARFLQVLLSKNVCSWVLYALLNSSKALKKTKKSSWTTQD